MISSQRYLTAVVEYEYAWIFDEASQEISTYTTAYIDSPGYHTAYAVVVNTAMPSPSQIETVGIPYKIGPGQTSTQYALATVATHMPTTPVLQPNHALVISTTDSYVQTAELPKAPCHEHISGRTLSLHASYLTYFQILLLCLFFGAYLWFRCLRHQRSLDDGLEKGRGTMSSLEKSAMKEAV
jgi:hypothetical protein